MPATPPCCVCGKPGTQYVSTGGGFDYRACIPHERLIWASLDLDKGWPMQHPEGTYCEDKETFLAEGFTLAVKAEVEQWEAHMGPVSTISDAFSQEAHDSMEPTDLKEAIARNQRETDPHVCHTHDFCDANMLMAGAFHAAGFLDAVDYKAAVYDVAMKEDGATADAAEEVAEKSTTNGEFDRLTHIWNDAWTLSKARAFEVPTVVA